MTPQPTTTPSHHQQLTAALETARWMTGQLWGDTAPAQVAVQSRAAFLAAGLPDILGVVLQVATPEVLPRYQALFGGELTTEQVAGSADVYTEHRLVGTVRDVPFLAWAHSDHQPYPDDIQFVVAPPGEEPADDGTAAATAVLTAGGPLEPGVAEQLHDVLDHPPGEASLQHLITAATEAERGEA